MALFFVFPQNTAYAGIGDVLGKVFLGEQDLTDAYIQEVVNDSLNGDIKIAGFDTKRFNSKEEASKYMAAVIKQQASNIIKDFNNASGWGKIDTIMNWNEHMDKNLEKSMKEVDKIIEQHGGDISKVNFGFEDAEIFGFKIGQKYISAAGELTPDEYQSIRKLDEQLTREAYAAMGVDEIPTKILDGLFEMSDNKEDFMKNLKNMSESDKKWFEESKTYYAYSAELTDDAIEIMTSGGFANLNELNQFYLNNKHRIKSVTDLKNITSQMQKDRDEIKKILNTLKPVNGYASSSGSKKGGFVLSGINLSLFGDVLDKDFPFDAKGAYGGYKFPDAEKEKQFWALIEKFKKDYNWNFSRYSPKVQELYTFYQNTLDKDEELKLAGDINTENHTFISKVIFTITKKTGSLGKIDVADMNTLNEVALKYSNKFASAYKDITGNAVPTPKVISKNSKSIVVELNYAEGIEKAASGSYYDTVRNHWSKIKGNHNRTSLVFDDTRNGFIPTMAFTNVTESGVYQIEADIYASRFHQQEKTYQIYVDCEEVDVKDKDGNVIGTRHVHGKTETQKYFPYRQKKGKDVHSYPTKNDTRNVKPDYIETDRLVGRAAWEVNVGSGGATPGGGTNPGCKGPSCPPGGTNPKDPNNPPGGGGPRIGRGTIIIPPYGVDSSDISISNFISN